MVVPYEKELQEQLANHLGLLERDLRFVATEYPLPNSEGTRGRIDILARDGHGSWVVIELKRANATTTLPSWTYPSTAARSPDNARSASAP